MSRTRFIVASLATALAPVRYLRMTLTASSGSWWSVGDVRAYVR